MKNEAYLRASVILTFILFVIYFYPYDYLTTYTTRSVAVLSLFFIDVVPSYYQNYIFFNFGTITPVSISPECSGLIAIIVFLFVVWLVPNMSLKNRVYAFALIPVIYFSNIVRILVGIIIANKFGADSLIIYHATMGQIFIFVVLIVCFITFVKFNENTVNTTLWRE